MLPSALLNPQIPKTFSLFPIILPAAYKLQSPQTLTFSRKSSSLSLASLSSSFQFPYQPQQEELVEEEEEEAVIGDCLVFEEGIFEDPYLQHSSHFHAEKPQSKKSDFVVEPQNLIPEKWKDVQEQINITKKERRKIAQQLEYGSRVEKKKKALAPISEEEYLSYRETKLAQLKPLVLESPTSFPVKEASKPADENPNESTSSRVVPRNPRWAVYGGTLQDISEFFNSGSYQPGGNTASEGPRKLFTKDEKFLLNRRIPHLRAATSGKWLPLHTLAASGEFYLMDGLLKHNVDINAVDKDGLTALHKAIIGKKQAITNYLLRESANPFVRDKEGATLMHYAVRTASSHAIKILLLYNVDINLQDNDGWTPLHLAVQTRRTDLVRLLLIKGADKTLKNRDGLSPLGLCLYSGQDARTYELIKLLKQLPKPRPTNPLHQ